MRQKWSRASRRARFRRAIRDRSGFGLIELLVASAVGGIGFLAIASMQLAAVTQGRIAESRTKQALAAQQVFEEIHRRGYGAAVSGSFATTVDGHTYNVKVLVTNTAIRVKRIAATVPGIGSLKSQSYITRIYEPRPVPTIP